MNTTSMTRVLAAALTAAVLGGPTAAFANWTPPAWSYDADEIASMPTVVLVMAGKTLPLRLLPNAKGFGPHARWSAEFGIVNDRGDYTAPPYTPQEGEDTLTYEDSSDPRHWHRALHFVVRILPNPKIPGSQFTPYNYPPSPDDPSQPPGTWPPSPVILTPPAKMPPPQFLRTMAVVKRGEKPTPPDELTAIHRVATITVAGVRVYRLPVHDDFNTVNIVYVLLAAPDAPLDQAKELPTFPGTPYTNPDPREPHLGKGGSRKWQTWRVPCS